MSLFENLLQFLLEAKSGSNSGGPTMSMGYKYRVPGWVPTAKF